MRDKHCWKLRRAVEEDVPEIVRLMQEAAGQLEDKTLFVCDDADFVRQHIAKRGFVVIACTEDGVIIGSLLLRYPGMDADNLGRDMGLDDANLRKVAHVESAVVAGDYRGNGLQGLMLQYAEKLLDRKRYQYLCATVSPNNPASFLTLEQNGYRCIMTKEKYAGYLRRIYCKMADGS